MSGGQEGTVRNLQELYTVAVGVALSLAIEAVVQAPGIRWGLWPMFAAFFITLVPFYHGGLRHLDHRYIEGAEQPLREGALLVDFLFLFMEACLLLGCARLLEDAKAVAVTLILLLIVDSIKGSLMYFVFGNGQPQWAELAWVRVNLVTLPILVVARFFLQDDTLPLALVAIATLRSGVDYWTSWRFYFPQRRHAKRTSPSVWRRRVSRNAARL